MMMMMEANKCKKIFNWPFPFFSLVILFIKVVGCVSVCGPLEEI
jgi:hypothetical protein